MVEEVKATTDPIETTETKASQAATINAGGEELKSEEVKKETAAKSELLCFGGVK